MIEIQYNGQPVSNYFESMPNEAHITVGFFKNKLSGIIGYFKDEIKACNGKIIISCKYDGRKLVIDIEYDNLSNELIDQIESRLA